MAPSSKKTRETRKKREHFTNLRVILTLLGNRTSTDFGTIWNNLKLWNNLERTRSQRYAQDARMNWQFTRLAPAHTYDLSANVLPVRLSAHGPRASISVVHRFLLFLRVASAPEGLCKRHIQVFNRTKAPETWGKELAKKMIESCPRHASAGTKDLVGRPVKCTCGYHSTAVSQ